MEIAQRYFVNLEGSDENNSINYIDYESNQSLNNINYETNINNMACNNYLSLLEQTIDDQANDQPIKKTKECKNTSKIECQNCINVKREFSYVNDENMILKQKLKEYENMLISKNKQILCHKNAEEREKKKSEELMRIYSKLFYYF